eukprot:6109261-Amphidinium_carterae.1
MAGESGVRGIGSVPRGFRALTVVEMRELYSRLFHNSRIGASGSRSAASTPHAAKPTTEEQCLRALAGLILNAITDETMTAIANARNIELRSQVITAGAKFSTAELKAACDDSDSDTEFHAEVIHRYRQRDQPSDSEQGCCVSSAVNSEWMDLTSAKVHETAYHTRYKATAAYLPKMCTKVPGSKNKTLVHSTRGAVAADPCARELRFRGRGLEEILTQFGAECIPDTSWKPGYVDKSGYHGVQGSSRASISSVPEMRFMGPHVIERIGNSHPPLKGCVTLVANQGLDSRSFVGVQRRKGCPRCRLPVTSKEGATAWSRGRSTLAPGQFEDLPADYNVSISIICAGKNIPNLQKRWEA